MSTVTKLFLDENDKVSLSLVELQAHNSVCVTLSVKNGYDTTSEVDIFAETPEQVQILRALVQAFHDNKATLEHLATV
jgi:dihydroorotase